MILLNDYTLITQGVDGMQYAIFPLIPILIGMVAGAAATGVVMLAAGIIYVSIKSIKGNKIAVLGMPGSGKTTFYNMLRYGEPRNPAPSYEDEYPKFSIKISDIRTIRIVKGLDIGGGTNQISRHYDDLITENDCIIFIFNINKYMNDFEGTYRKDTNARFDYMYRHIKKIKKETNKDKDFVSIGSHLDELSEERQKSVYNDFISLVSEKEYNKLFENNCFMMNICSIEALHEMMNKLFDQNVIY